MHAPVISEHFMTPFSEAVTTMKKKATAGIFSVIVRLLEEVLRIQNLLTAHFWRKPEKIAMKSFAGKLSFGVGPAHNV